MSESRRPPRPGGSGGSRKGSPGGSGAARGGRSGGAKKGHSGGAHRGSQGRWDRPRTTDASPPPPRTRSERGTTERAGGPAPRGGPRDPMLEEIRASTPKAKQEAALAAFEHARGLLQRGRDGAAAQAAAEAKSLAPRSGSVRELLGVALYRADQYRDALQELQAYRRMTGRLDQTHLIADSY